MSKGGMPPATARSMGVLVWNIWPDHLAWVTRSSYGSAPHICSQVFGERSSSRRAVTTTPSSSISISRAIVPPLAPAALERIGSLLCPLAPEDDALLPFEVQGGGLLLQEVQLALDHPEARDLEGADGAGEAGLAVADGDLLDGRIEDDLARPLVGLGVLDLLDPQVDDLRRQVEHLPGPHGVDGRRVVDRQCLPERLDRLRRFVFEECRREDRAAELDLDLLHTHPSLCGAQAIHAAPLPRPDATDYSSMAMTRAGKPSTPTTFGARAKNWTVFRV